MTRESPSSDETLWTQLWNGKNDWGKTKKLKINSGPLANLWYYIFPGTMKCISYDCQSKLNKMESFTLKWRGNEDENQISSTF